VAGPGGNGRSKHALFALKLVLSAGLLWFVLSRADLAQVWAAVRGADPMPIGLALLTPLLGYTLTSTRWRGLLRIVGAHIPPGPLWRASLIAVFFNQFMPSTIGGDAIRVYEAWRHGASRSAALSSIVVDRVIGTFALVLLAVGMLPFVSAAFENPWAVYGAVLAVGAIVTVLMLMLFLPIPGVIELFHRCCAALPGPAARIAGKLDRAFAPYRGRWRVLPVAMALSLLLQANVVLMHWLIGLSLGIEVSIVQFCFLVPVAMVVMMIPVSINGIGLREGIFALLLGAYGVESSQAVALALMSYALFLVHGVAGGIVFGLRGTRLAQVREAQTDQPPSGVSA
jgi:hypothetical protein